MVINPTLTRRTVLKAVGAAGALGSISTASARELQQDGDELRLFSEQAVDNAMEVVTQQNYAYVATGKGMAIVDWSDPDQPELVADITASDAHEIGGDDPDGGGHVGGILDVKVDGDGAVMAHNSGTGITTVDVSDPANPEELAFYQNQDATGVHNCYISNDTVYLTVSANRVTDDGIRIFGNTGVEIVDVSDPMTPTHVATWYLYEELPDYANAGVNPNHDLYEQDGLLYNAFWDAGIVVLDVSDPSSPEFVTQFGAAEQGDEVIPPYQGQEDYFGEIFPLDRYYAGDGNAHYVQPSPNGDYTYVGDEKFPNRLEEDPDTDQYGGVRIFDTSDFDNVEQVGYISPPDVDVGLRTAHNFDVTQNRIHTSWYNGGVQVHDITDETDPEELFSYNPEGYSFWTAVQGRGFTLGGIYGARSDASNGGVAFLHADRGQRRAPSFDGSAPPRGPEVEMNIDEDE